MNTADLLAAALPRIDSAMGLTWVDRPTRRNDGTWNACIRFIEEEMGQDVLSMPCDLAAGADDAVGAVTIRLSPEARYVPPSGERWEYVELLVRGLRDLNMRKGCGASYFDPEAGRIVTHSSLRIAALEEGHTALQEEQLLSWLTDVLATGREAAFLVARLTGTALLPLEPRSLAC